MKLFRMEPKPGDQFRDDALKKAAEGVKREAAAKRSSGQKSDRELDGERPLGPTEELIAEDQAKAIIEAQSPNGLFRDEEVSEDEKKAEHEPEQEPESALHPERETSLEALANQDAMEQRSQEGEEHPADKQPDDLKQNHQEEQLDKEALREKRQQSKQNHEQTDLSRHGKPLVKATEKLMDKLPVKRSPTTQEKERIRSKNRDRDRGMDR